MTAVGVLGAILVIVVTIVAILNALGISGPERMRDDGREDLRTMARFGRTRRAIRKSTRQH